VLASRAIRKLGGTSTAVFPAGGPAGKLLQDMLTAERIEHRATPIGSPTRENLNVAEESRDTYYRFLMPGPLLSQTELADAMAAVFAIEPAPDYLIISGSMPPQTPHRVLADLVARARERNIKVALDATGKHYRKALDEGVHLIKPNLKELQDAVGRQAEDDGEIEAAARQLIEGGHAEIVVVSLAAAGALLATGDQVEFIRAPVVPMRCRIGAGDSMMGAMVLAMARGYSPIEAARFGVAAGSAAVMTTGGELCRRDDTQRLYEQMAEHQRTS
jgi:6-phosphofructokinase 2